MRKSLFGRGIETFTGGDEGWRKHGVAFGGVLQARPSVAKLLGLVNKPARTSQLAPSVANSERGGGQHTVYVKAMAT